LYHFTGGEFFTTRSGRTLRDLRPDVFLALGEEEEKFLPLEEFLEKYCRRR
jgi:hypothetical protein